MIAAAASPRIRRAAYAPESAAALLLCEAAVSGCRTSAGSLPLLACMGNWGIGGTSGISSAAPLSISASAASTSLKSASDAESAADFRSPAGAGG
jgi:hypothetical protein